MSEKKCCVSGCVESGNMHQVLHQFPNPEKDRERFNTWLMAIGGDILACTNNFIYQRRRVCHAHFEQHFCCRFNRISKVAVPTINMPDHLSLQRMPLRQLQSVVCDINIRPSTSSNAAEASIKATTLCDSLGEKENTPVQEHTSNSECSVGTGVENIKAVTFSDQLGKMKNIHINEQTSTRTAEFNAERIQKLTKKRPIKHSSVEQVLYKKLTSLRVKLSKCRNKIRKQLMSVKGAKRMAKNNLFLKTMENLPSTAKILTLMQVKQCKKTSKGRRFTTEEKILALSIWKQSPKAYRFLRKLLILPSPQTLIKILNLANIGPGINEKLFNQLKQKAEKMKMEDRICVLIFDEINIMANVQYNERTDNVRGSGNNDGYANHVQQLMIRGLVKNYKHPISYYYSCGPTKAIDLAKQIKENIIELQKAGFIVVATICDQGAGNRGALKILIEETRGNILRQGEEPKGNTILINNHEIIPLYDPPHLLKCIRNNLLNKNLKYKINGVEGTAKWSDVETLHKENPGYRGMRLIPKMTDNHVVPQKIGKMKVKYAAQIFSQTVGKTMGYLADKGILPQESKETADLLLFFDKLFDSVNGSYGKGNKIYGKPLLGPVKPNSAHHKFWEDAKHALRSMQFLNQRRNEEDKTIPTIKNWIWTLDGIQKLIKDVKEKYAIDSIWMRHLNQDPIENFFGSIRSHGCRNNNPTPAQYEAAYATLLINSLSSVHSSANNCQIDFCESLQALVIEKDIPSTPVCTTINEIPIINFTPLEIKKEKPQIIAALENVTGYFAKQSKKRYFKNCKKCVKDLNGEESDFVKRREYAGRRWLCNGSIALINCISQFQDIYHQILKSNLFISNLKLFVKSIILINIDFNFITCQEHKEGLIDFLINLSARFFINHYCKNINLILTGKKDIDDDEDCNQVRAKKTYSKCFKRKSNVISRH